MLYLMDRYRTFLTEVIHDSALWSCFFVVCMWIAVYAQQSVIRSYHPFIIESDSEYAPN